MCVCVCVFVVALCWWCFVVLAICLLFVGLLVCLLLCLRHCLCFSRLSHGTVSIWANYINVTGAASPMKVSFIVNLIPSYRANLSVPIGVGRAESGRVRDLCAARLPAILRPALSASGESACRISRTKAWVPFPPPSQRRPNCGRNDNKCTPTNMISLGSKEAHSSHLQPGGPFNLDEIP